MNYNYINNKFIISSQFCNFMLCIIYTNEKLNNLKPT